MYNQGVGTRISSYTYSLSSIRFTTFSLSHINFPRYHIRLINFLSIFCTFFILNVCVRVCLQALATTTRAEKRNENKVNKFASFYSLPFLLRRASGICAVKRLLMSREYVFDPFSRVACKMLIEICSIHIFDAPIFANPRCVEKVKVGPGSVNTQMQNMNACPKRTTAMKRRQ